MTTVIIERVWYISCFIIEKVYFYKQKMISN